MINLTISGGDAEEFQSNVAGVLSMFRGVTTVSRNETGGEVIGGKEQAEAPKPAAARQSRKAATPVAETPAASPPADEVDRELLEEVPPAPTAAGQVVDAGTGKPAAQQVVEAEATEVKQMTMDDVRKAAAQLAAKDTDALKALLTKYGAPNLSGVPQDMLADFAGDVVAALG